MSNNYDEKNYNKMGKCIGRKNKVIRNNSINNKSKIIFLFVLLVIIICGGILGCKVMSNKGVNFLKCGIMKNKNLRENKFKYEFGIFTGMDKSSVSKFKDYKIIVIDTTDYSKQDIEKFKKEGHVVYSYLNVGSLETFRNYYDEFKDKTLGDYAGWDNEEWIDVTNKDWQDFIINSLAKEMSEKKVDAFFIDNMDIYYNFKDDASKKTQIYSSLVKILQNLKEKYRQKIIINGGDFFVQQLIDEQKSELIDGINQESVFNTAVTDADGKVQFVNQKPEDREYFFEYINKCKKNMLDVSITEYVKDVKTKKEIKNYCKKNKVKYFISSTLKLNKVVAQ